MPLPQRIRSLCRLAGKKTLFTFLSKKHKELFPSIKNAHVIPLGVKPNQFPFCPKPKEYLAFVGTVADKKGILEAIEINKKAGLPLKIAARIRTEDKDFYQKYFLKVKNKSEHVEFIGEVSDQERNNLLKYARAMLFPIKWEEPFGFVMIESLAVGTPVIAFNRGSVPEVITDGKTGYIVENIHQAVKAVNQIDSLSRHDCRESIEKKFSIEIAAQKYNTLYKSFSKNK